MFPTFRLRDRHEPTADTSMIEKCHHWLLFDAVFRTLMSFDWSSSSLVSDGTRFLPGRLTSITRQESESRSRKPTRTRRESAQELGSGGIVQDSAIRLADSRPRELHLRHERRSSAVRGAHAKSRDLQRHHHAERVLLSAPLRLRVEPQDFQTHDADFRVGGAGGVQWASQGLVQVAPLGCHEE